MKIHGNSISYHIVTSKELTSLQKNIIKRITKTYNEQIDVIKLNNLSVLKGYSRSWPPIVYARLLIGEHFDIPYMAIDADVLFFDKIDDISFLTKEKPIASLCDSLLIKRGKLEKLNKAFECHIDKYLNGGTLMVLPNAISKSVVPDFLSRYGKHPALEHNEQDILNIVMGGKTQYYPEGYGILLYNTIGKAWKAQETGNILNGKYKFAHIFEKQWNTNSSFYPLHAKYLNEIGIINEEE